MLRTSLIRLSNSAGRGQVTETRRTQRRIRGVTFSVSSLLILMLLCAAALACWTWRKPERMAQVAIGGYRLHRLRNERSVSRCRRDTSPRLRATQRCAPDHSRRLNCWSPSTISRAASSGTSVQCWVCPVVGQCTSSRRISTVVPNPIVCRSGLAPKLPPLLTQR